MTVISTVSGKAVKTISVDREAGAIAITPNGKTAYAIGSALTPIRTATNTTLKAIKLAGSDIIVRRRQVFAPASLTGLPYRGAVPEGTASPGRSSQASATVRRYTAVEPAAAGRSPYPPLLRGAQAHRPGSTVISTLSRRAAGNLGT